MPRRKRTKPIVETPVDYKAPGFDPNTLLGYTPKGPLNFQACFFFATKGSAPHQNRVAEYYLEGKVVNRDCKEALAWFRLSAKKGNPHAMRRLGDLYRDGKGVGNNPWRAFEYYRESAEMGHHPAIYELGRCYEEGIGCDPDPEQARSLYEKAVAVGGNQKARARIQKLDKPKRTRRKRKSVTVRVKPAPVVKSTSRPSPGSRPAKRLAAKNASPNNGERDWSPFLGACAYHASVSDFLRTSKIEWMAGICEAVNEMFPDENPLDPNGNSWAVKAFRATFDRFSMSLGQLSRKYSFFGKLQIAFEYVIPVENPEAEGAVAARRADAVLFGKDRVAVLELKTGTSKHRLEERKGAAIGQTHDYLRGLKKWHCFVCPHPEQLRGGVVMFALDQASFEEAERQLDDLDEPVSIISPDELDDLLLDWFKNAHTPVEDPRRWLRGFSASGTPVECVFRDVSDYAFEHHETMPVLDDDEKATVRDRIALRLGLRSTKKLRPLVEALTGGKWQLRDAVVQILENLPQERLETLFEGWLNQK